MNALWLGLAVLLGAPPGSEKPSSAQPAEDPSESAPPSQLPEITKKTGRREALAVLAQYLDPALYPPALSLGAQAEALGPALGVTSAVVGYDAISMQVELSVGFVAGGDPVLDVDIADGYLMNLRLAFPVHRGIKSDFALFAGGGPAIIHPSRGDTYVLGDVQAGARFRIFQTPNIALIATLGAGALVRGQHSKIIFGARPLGSAGVVYYFR